MRTDRPSSMQRLFRSRKGRLAFQIAFFLIVCVIWQTVHELEIVPPILVPGPLSIAAQFWDNIVSLLTGGFMLEHFLTTLVEVLLGFAAAIVIGLCMGALVSEFRPARVALMPYVIAFNATPGIAVAPMVLIWFGFGISSKVVMVTISALFPIIIGTIAGLNAADRSLLRLLRVYGATRLQTLVKLRLRSALPHFFAGLEIGVVGAVVGAVVAEFTGGSAGLGYIIIVAQESLNLPLAFASLILLGLTGLSLHRIVLAVRNWTVYWEAEEATPLTPQPAETSN